MRHAASTWQVLKLKGHGEFHVEFLDTAGQDEFHIMGTRYRVDLRTARVPLEYRQSTARVPLEYR